MNFVNQEMCSLSLFMTDHVTTINDLLGCRHFHIYHNWYHIHTIQERVHATAQCLASSSQRLVH